ncbi:semaphorin-5A-like [Saccoglossus kowalevskii]|uniref:Hemicentin-1-like n=1 Tax=Saccoglossus kowalevskii TaxID=10224 RepID=A0ABM0GU75_SACKO|nr:PREDICTED: hemicentin-1-like [Saccoglossus kowalevskii]
MKTAYLCLAFMALASRQMEVFAMYEMKYTPPNYPSENKTLVGFLIRSFDYSHHVTVCGKACLNDGKCKSFNYKEETTTCELNKASHLDSESALEDSDGYIYLMRDAFFLPAEALGACASDPCGNGTCQETCDGKFLCVCEYGVWTGDICETPVVHGGWGDWGLWEGCSVSCGTGVHYRFRQCNNPTPSEYGGRACKHENNVMNVDAEKCNTTPCPQWAMWEPWSICQPGHTSCGLGTRSRMRSCMYDGTPDVDPGCTGSTTETGVPCMSRDCDVPLKLTGSSTYGEGILEIYDNIRDEWGTICDTDFSSHDANIACRQMGFSGSAVGTPTITPISDTSYPILLSNVECTGSEVTLTTCTHNGWREVTGCSHDDDVALKCAVDARWGKWSPWSLCSLTCGAGVQTRTRVCDPRSGGTCIGVADDTLECEVDTCNPEI